MNRSVLKILGFAGAFAISLMSGGAPAKASDYCREYTRTVYIGSQTQEAYGTACLQQDGSWMIVGEGPMRDIGNNVSGVDYVIHDQRRNIVPPRVVYYDRSPVVYRTGPSFVWYNGGHYRNGHHVAYKRNYGYNNGHHYGWRNGRGHDRHWDRHDRRDRHDHRRGRDDDRRGR